MAEQVWSINEINARLRELSPLVLTDGLFLYYARVDECIEQELNPRAMPQAMFDQLVSNIEGVKGLESTPLCVQTGRGLEIISGHHRLRAARTAQLEHVLVLVYEGLASDRIFSKQLAHNTISGVDDPQMVKRVWERITDLQARFEAYVDPRSFQKVPERVGFTQVDIDMGALAQTAMLVFLASQMADFDEAVQRLLPKVELDRVYLAQREVYDGWRDALQRVREDLEIVSIPTAVAEMARLAMQALDAMTEDGTEDGAAEDGPSEEGEPGS